MRFVVCAVNIFLRTAGLAGLLGSLGATAAAAGGVDLAKYQRIGAYDLPIGSGVKLLADQASKPQGSYSYDPEGLVCIGKGQFVLGEERSHQLNPLTYTAGTASNGSASTVNPALRGGVSINDVFSLSNLSTPNGDAAYSHLMLLSADSGRVVETDRAGKLLGSLNVGTDGQLEGLTMDAQGRLSVVGEQAGSNGGSGLWVCAAPVPEPGSWALMAGGLAQLGAAARRPAAR